ncbi:MAG TPA: UbiA family prenyltransferase [Acidobacteriaceae bacterium]|jgi:4-hydroxybenzoate polyprenyltransferase|nr:UbiA family prenyltransferase [Acidobacteriaceae bacterium]
MSDLEVIEPFRPVQVQPALCVDLDGTLVKSDTLLDSLMVLARKHPQALLSTPIWAARGKAHLKARVSALALLDAAHLPYNRAVVEYLRRERAAGRQIYLTTGADTALAERVASFLGVFDGVLASDGAVNLTGNKKLKQLQSRFSVEGFDYVGNAIPDLPLLKGARQAMVANPDLRLNGALRLQNVQVSQRFIDRTSRVPTVARALRVHQWAKNVLVFLPLLLAHSLRWSLVAQATAAFVSFCCAASATYIFNDLLDLESDRAHLTKRNRAFASGNLSVLAGVGISAVLLAASLAIAFFLPHRFFIFLALYLGTTVAYSFYLKRVVLVDVVVLSGLYTIRVLAGGAATATTVSPWMGAFSIFLFLSLAMVKRFSELENLEQRGMTAAKGRGYLVSDIEQLRSFGTASAYASILVFALYINGHDVTTLYRHPDRMWLITPLMILWVSRIWLLASRGELHEDPVVFAITDRMSLLIGAGVAVITLLSL